MIATCKDGEKGFAVCAESMDDLYLQSAFAARSEECAQAAGRLQELVRSIGGKPEKSSSRSGRLHRRWVDLKSLLTGSDTVAVLKECERGERVALDAYRAALGTHLPDAVRAVVEEQMQNVRHNHERIAHLRASAQAGSMMRSGGEHRYH